MGFWLSTKGANLVSLSQIQMSPSFPLAFFFHSFNMVYIWYSRSVVSRISSWCSTSKSTSTGMNWNPTGHCKRPQNKMRDGASRIKFLLVLEELTWPQSAASLGCLLRSWSSLAFKSFSFIKSTIALLTHAAVHLCGLETLSLTCVPSGKTSPENLLRSRVVDSFFFVRIHLPLQKISPQMQHSVKHYRVRA